MLPARIPLAVTAAAEHFTAVLAERLLGDEDFRAIPGDAEVWNLLKWHALEELEHKSVAFDVFRSVGGIPKRAVSQCDWCVRPIGSTAVLYFGV
ncbi:metal-dependent hydrolase [Mycobacteroides abscessus subsp. abscessus]|nr:metal-dependent hydrolase [Mycobacteroides abscessus subsp. abscessus]